MVAVVAGNGLGLFNTSLNILGAAAGSFGQGTLGQAGGKAWVNASNGNLVLRFTDEQLSGLGQDLFHTRTYNTLGNLNDADGDGWRWDGERRVVLSGTALAAGSRLTRTTGDGHETVYAWNGSRYQSGEGDGAHDFIQWDTQTRQWYWTDGSTRSVERYDGDSGLLNSVADSQGTLITYGYQNGKLASVTDSSGQALLMVYNAAGKLARVDTRSAANGPLTQQVYYEYDNFGRLTQVRTDLTPDDNSIADGNVYATSYTYDGSSFRIASITQGDGTTASFTYELVGSDYRVKTVTDQFGTTTFTYLLSASRTLVSNSLGQSWSYDYNGNGQLVFVQSPNNNGTVSSTRYTYDADGNVSRITDTSGNVISYTYDERGNRILERDPLGVTLARVFSASNQVLSEIRYSQAATWNASSSTWTEPPASSAQVTRYVYDYADHLRFVVGATGSVVEYTYEGRGLRAQEIVHGANLYPVNALAVTATLAESTLVAWSATQPRAQTRLTAMNYDYRGNLILKVAYANVDAGGNWLLDSAAALTRYVYNAQGQLLQTLAGRGANLATQVLLSSTAYDGMGRVVGQMDASGTRTTVYNGSQRSIAVTSASGLTLTQTYDTQGRLVSIEETAVGVASRITRYYYDAAGRLTMTQDATGVRTYTFYDALGRIGVQVDGAGNATGYTYDRNGRRITETRYDLPVNTSAWFNGSTVTMVLGKVPLIPGQGNRVTRFNYDQAGRLLSSVDGAGTVTSYQYDGRGQLVRQQTGDRVTRTFYDADGRQVGQLDAEGYLRENRYDAAGQLQQVSRYAVATTVALRAAGSLAELRPAGASLSTWNFYDGAGRQIGSVDEQGFVSETVYNEAGNATQSIRYLGVYTAALNAQTAFAAVRAAVVAAGSEATVSFYDNLGRLSRRVVVDGTTTTFEYDAAGRLVRETTAAGTAEERSTRTLYDAFGQTTGKLLGEASARITAGMTQAQIAVVYSQYGTTWSYDAAGRVASVTDALGNRTVSYYDAAGRLTRVINAVGEVSETKYNTFGEAIDNTRLGNRLAAGSLGSLSGGLQTAALDSLLAAIRNAGIDSRTSYAYDTRGLLLTSIDAEGISTTNQYDQYGQLQRQIRVIAGSRTVTSAWGYNLRGEKISQTRDVGGLNLSDTITYDAFGRVIRSTDAAGNVSTSEYLDNGRTVVARDALDQARRSEFDAFGRTLREVDALGRVTQYSYDDVNRSVTVTLPGGTQVSTWKTRHGETLKTVDGNGAVTQYEYDREGRLLRTLDVLGQVAAIKRYDKAGRLSESVDAAGVVTRLEYDAANRVVQRSVDPSGLNQRTTYEFDTAGRQVRVVENAGAASTRITEYRYDRNGQLRQRIVDPAGLQISTRYSHDGVGNVISVSQGTVASPDQRVTEYSFDNLGRRIEERVDPQGFNLRTQYQYNASGQVSRKLDAGGGVTDYVYDAAGQLRFTVDALNHVSERTYDVAGNLLREIRYANTLVGARDPATLQTLTQSGSVLKQSLASAGDRVTRYIYNTAGQLETLVDPVGNSETYSYDAAGNRTRLINKNGQIWYYRYDKLGRLIEEMSSPVWLLTIDSAGQGSGQWASVVTRYGYDGLGNMTWRSEGRLRASLSSDPALDDLSQARTTTYGYDALGRQVRITSPGWYNKVTGRYQQNADGSANTFQVTTEVSYDGLGNAVRNRVRINNTGVAANDYVDSYKAYDVLGQVRYEVDALKGVTAYEYDVFGAAVLTRRHALALNAAVPASGYYQLADFNASTLPASPGNDRTIITRYDRLGRKTEVQQDRVSLYAFTGNVVTSSVKSVTPVKVYSYNAFGQVTRETLVARDATGASVMEQISTVNYYDLAGQRVGTVDALGYYTRLEYSGSGKVSRQVEYATALASWSEAALPTPVANGKDRSVRFVYDGSDRLVQTVRENVSYWQQSFAANASRATMTLVTGDVLVSSTTYDGMGNVRTQRDALGNVTTTEYNALGLAVQVIEPARATARSGAVNPFDNAVSAAPTTVYGYNALGQVVYELHIADTGQTGPAPSSRSLYDAAGHLIKEFDTLGATQDFKVDVAGRRVEETRQVSSILTGWRANNQTLRRTFSYDSLGQQLNSSDWYTDNGVQKSTTNAVTYNRFGEITAELLNGNYKARYAYDQVGNVIEQSNAQGITSLSYDLTGKVSRSTQLGDLTSVADDRITYLRNDLLGRVLEQHLPKFEANTSADTLNNVSLTLVTPIIRQTSDRWGNVLSRTDPRGYVNRYSYDHNNQVLTETLPETDILRENGTSYRASLIHERRYDAIGQLLEEADLVGPYSGVASSTWLRSRQHVYNQTGDLVRDIDALGASRDYAVDANGNRVGTRDALGVVTFDEYDAMDRHTVHGIVRNGQRVILQTNQYDQAGRLYAQISGTSTVTETLASTPNADGSSTINGVAGNTKLTLFDERGNIVATRNESNIQKTFVFNEANRKVAEVDGLGNSLTWTYNEGDYGRLVSRADLSKQVFSYSYNAFGQLVKEANPSYYQNIYLGTYERTYQYYGNGLLKSTRDEAVGSILGDMGWSMETYAYDQSGQRVREYSQFHAEDHIMFFPTVSGDKDIRYKFDEQGRLKELKTPAGWELTNGTVFPVATGRVDSLKYDYDELGNRRRTYLDTTNQSGARTVIDDWYKYDLEGRVLVGSGYLSNGKVVAGKLAGKAKGYAMAYDTVGRRLSSEEWSASISGGERYARSTYSYNDMGQVLEARSGLLTRAGGADTAAAVQVTDAEKLLFRNTYDALGNRSSQMSYSNNVAVERSTYSYRGDGQVVAQLVYKISGGVERKSQANYFGEAGMIDAAGNQASYRYVTYGSNGTSISYRGAYVRTFWAGDTYKESNIEVTTNLSSRSGWTSTVHDSRGNATSVMTYNGSILNQSFTSNKEGLLTARLGSDSQRAQSYLYYQGAALANYGNLSAAQISDTLTPISEEYPSRTPGNYVVNQGDTLASIAQAVWGDSKMWYLIADANGIDPAKVLVVGDSIRIPNVVGSTHNDATTFKPYNAGDVIGDTTPTPVFPPPPKPKKKKCNAVASIVMVVVAVVATVFTAGAAGALIAGTASSLSTAAAAGVAAFSGTMAVGGMGLVAAAGIGAVVGSLASQTVGKAMGVVDKISWKQAAVAGLGGAIGAGITTIAAGANSTLGSAFKALGDSSATWQQTAMAFGAQGVAGYAGGYIASKMVGLDTSFSWKNMAASAVASIVGGSINQSSGFLNSAVRQQISAHTSAWMKDKFFGGDRPDYGQVAIDAFGNTLANYVIGRINEKREVQKLKSEALSWYEATESERNIRFNDKSYWVAALGDPRKAINFDSAADLIRSSGSDSLELDAVEIRAFADDVVPESSPMEMVMKGLFIDFPKSMFELVREGVYTEVDAVASIWKFGIERVSDYKVQYTPLSDGFVTLQEKGPIGFVANRATAVAEGIVAPFKAIYDKDYRAIGANLPALVPLVGSVAKAGARLANNAKVARSGGRTASPGESEAPPIDPAGSGNPVRAVANRLLYMGRTPSKYSRTGRDVVERMREEGFILGEGELLRGNPNNLMLVNADGSTVRIGSNVDMAHRIDAVTWWNETGRFFGAKSPEVRTFMLDPNNYVLQLGSINRSAGAKLNQVYLPPAFGELKR